MQDPNRFTDPDEMVDPEEQLPPSALAEVISMARADQDGIQDAEAHVLADRVMDVPRLEHEDRVAADRPATADLVESSRRHLQWLQRETAKTLHNSFALQRDQELCAAYAAELHRFKETLPAFGPVPVPAPAYSDGPVGSAPASGPPGHRRRHRGSRGAAA